MKSNLSNENINLNSLLNVTKVSSTIWDGLQQLSTKAPIISDTEKCCNGNNPYNDVENVENADSEIIDDQKSNKIIVNLSYSNSLLLFFCEFRLD